MANIVLNNIYKVYEGGVRAVSDFNLDIGDKEFVVFVGPSGCGKSTTLRMIAGLEEITAGSLFMDGVLVNDVEPKDRNIAMVFQAYALYPHMTVFQNMSFGLKIHKLPAEEIERRVNRAAEILGITDLLLRKPKALSGGQRQRVALGRAIVREPSVFLLDEPLSNLDAKLRVQMRTEITKLHQRLATTFIYVTHDQTEAMTMGSRIVVMKDGYIQQADTPSVLYEEPINVFVATFLGSPQMNIIKTTLHKENKGSNAMSKLLSVNVGGVALTFPENKRKQYIGEDSLVDVLFGIRPENVSVSLEGGVPAKIDIVEHLGKETIVYCKIAGKEENVIASVPVDHTLKAGMDIFLHIDMNKAHLFDAATEQSVMGVPRYNKYACTYSNGSIRIDDVVLTMTDDFNKRAFDFASRNTVAVHMDTTKITTDEKADAVQLSGKVAFVVHGSDSAAVYVKINGIRKEFVYRTKQDVQVGDEVALYVPLNAIWLVDADGNRTLSQHVVSDNTAKCVVKRDGDKLHIAVGPTRLTIDARDGVTDGAHTIRLVSDKLKVVYTPKFIKENNLEKSQQKANVTALAYDEDMLGTTNAVFVKLAGWDNYVTAVVNNDFSVYKMPKFGLIIPDESIIIE